MHITNQFNIIRLYTDKDGISHFQQVSPHDMNTNILESVPGLLFSPMMHATGFILETFSADFFIDWHTPPDGKRYAGIFVEGSMCFEASDGEKRIVSAGDVLFYEDTTGQGHRTYGVTAGKEVIIVLP